MRKRSEVRAAAEVPEVTPEPVEDEIEHRNVPVARLEFPSANAAQDVEFEPGLQRIIETVWVKDTYSTYQEIVEFLKAKDQRTTRDLDEVEFVARKAHDLWMTAKQERLRWELDNKVVAAAMYERAAIDLQREKASGERSKQITDADIQARCALLYPDEYRHQELRQGSVKRAEESMGNLVELLNSKCRNMATIISKQR